MFTLIRIRKFTQLVFQHKAIPIGIKAEGDPPSNRSAWTHPLWLCCRSVGIEGLPGRDPFIFDAALGFIQSNRGKIPEILKCSGFYVSGYHFVGMIGRVNLKNERFFGCVP